MAAKSKQQDARSNVLVFRRRDDRAPLAIQCEDIKAVAICVHCGGWLAEGESADDCSSARVSQTV
ncbi:hypothetical protein X566_05430 [Afipia sp. P52-10]|nr:hypothetical protein X566_05430 [Afipia sp. P52-10]